MATSEASPPLSELLTRLRAAWPSGRWEWDGRLRCALATVDQNGRAGARQALAAVLPALFTASTVGEAPSAVKQICDSTGGLRGEQEVFTTTLPDATVAYCLWWPWGTGTTFSARIGAAGGAADLAGAVKGAFGL